MTSTEPMTLANTTPQTGDVIRLAGTDGQPNPFRVNHVREVFDVPLAKFVEADIRSTISGTFASLKLITHKSANNVTVHVTVDRYTARPASWLPDASGCTITRGADK